MPTTYILAVLVENIFAAAANATATAIIFGAVGKDNPLAATQFAIFAAAAFLPQTYMQAVDGFAYSLHGLTGMLASDAGLSVLCCSIFALILMRFSKHYLVVA